MAKNKKILSTILVSGATLASSPYLNQNNNSLDSDFSLYSTQTQEKSKFLNETNIENDYIFDDVEEINRITKIVAIFKSYRPISEKSKFLSKMLTAIDGDTKFRVLASAALQLNDANNLELMNGVLFSGINYLENWFKKYLEFLIVNLKDTSIKYSAENLLGYFFK